MRRSAVSISSNIAEGSGRTSDVDFARFLEIAYGSLMENVSQARIASLQGSIQGCDYDVLNDESERLARMLSGLRASLLQQRKHREPTSRSRLSTLDL